jgi:hypothetical protein
VRFNLGLIASFKLLGNRLRYFSTFNPILDGVMGGGAIFIKNPDNLFKFLVKLDYSMLIGILDTISLS